MNASRLYRYVEILKRTRFGLGLDPWGVLNYLKHSIYPKNERMNLSHYGPIIVSVVLTYRCNLRCSFCSFGVQDRNAQGKPEMTPDDLRRILDTKFARNCLVVYLSGGEPTLNPSLASIIRVVKERKKQCHMVTNGTLLHSVLPEIVNAGIDEIDISIYDNTVNALEKTLPGVCARFPSIHISYVLLRTVVEKYPEKIDRIIDVCKKSGCRSLQINLCRSFGNDDSEIIFDDCSAYDEYIVRSRSRDAGFRIVYPRAMRRVPLSTKTKRCLVPWQQGNVDANGNLAMCLSYESAFDSNGNIFVDDDNKSYNSPIICETRRRLLSHDSDVHERCAKCVSLTGCVNV